MSANTTCGTCQFFEAMTSGGLCHRRPPVIVDAVAAFFLRDGFEDRLEVDVPGDVNIAAIAAIHPDVTLFPHVWIDDWCGEWAADVTESAAGDKPAGPTSS